MLEFVPDLPAAGDPDARALDDTELDHRVRGHADREEVERFVDGVVSEHLVRVIDADGSVTGPSHFAAALTDPEGSSGKAKPAPYNFFYGPSYSDALRAELTWAAEDWKAKGKPGKPKA